MENNIAVAIDIGTTKIFVIVAEINRETGSFQVRGHGVAPSHGLRKGLIVDAEKLTYDIKQAIAKAELMSGLKINKAFVGVSGRHIESVISSAEIDFEDGPRTIVEEDYKKLVQRSINKVVTYDREVLHEIVFNYRVDSSGIIKNPIGMVGTTLKADVHLITGSEKEIITLNNALKNLDIEVDEIVLEPYASAKSVLTQSEKQFGTIIVDIGGGTSDIGIYRNEKLIYTSVIPIGGEHFTNDIAYCLQVDFDTADRVKKDFSLIEFEKDEEISLSIKNTNETKKVKLQELKEIIDARIDDILDHVMEKIEASGFKDYISNGLVFTGGSSQIGGLEERAESVIDYDIKIGFPIEVEGLMENMNKPENATGIGLLLYAVEKNMYEKIQTDTSTVEKPHREKATKRNYDAVEEDEENAIDTMAKKVKKFFSSLF